jgi:hypothetical protein
MRKLIMTRGKRKLFWIVPAVIVGITLFIFIGGQLVMHLWNWLLPTLFGWRQVTFWQAVGVLALCRILFGGFGRHGYGRSNIRRRISERMEERYAAMTPEERERFRQNWRGRCGFGPPASESK